MQSSARPSAVPSASATVSATPVVPAPSERAAETVFDCEGLGAKLPTTCEGLPAAARELIEAARWSSASAIPCAGGLSGERLERAAGALGRAARVDPSRLSPLARAQLQNAALRLLACSVSAQPREAARRVTTGAQALVARLAFSDGDLAALPTAESQLRPWLEQPATWVGAAERRSRIHETSSGYTLAQEPLKGVHAFANVARLIVVDTKGAPRVTDTVARIQMRRVSSSQVRVCIAELDAGQGCDAALRPIEATLGKTMLTAPGGPTCSACHPGGRSPSSNLWKVQGVGSTAARANAAHDDSAALAVRELGPLLAKQGQ